MAAPKSQLNPARSSRRIESMTREEIEAKLEAVEARTETRFVELSGKIDRLGEILTGERGVLAQMAGLRTDVFAQMTALRTDVFAQMAALRNHTTAQIAALRDDTTAQIAALRDDTTAQMAVLKTDNLAQTLALKADNKATRWTVIATMITSVLAAAALVLSVQANLLSAFQAGQPQSAMSTPR
ncbi:hypothetical protein ASD89_14105 [Caulobacter sp. Root656]|nr:hypothetical protein ASD89_14105 [Caulobacter sp. Root656]